MDNRSIRSNYSV